MRNLSARLFVFVAFFSLTLSSCGGGNPFVSQSSDAETSEFHQHGGSSSDHLHHSDKWDSDSDNHWKICDEDGEVFDKSGHDFSIERTDATYETPELLRYVCHTCGYSYEETGKTLEHAYSPTWSSNELGHWHQCIDEGYEDLKKGFSEHSYVTSVVEPTYSSEGYTIYSCTICQYTIEMDRVPALTHSYSSDWTYDSQYHWHQCVDAGYEDLTQDKMPHRFSSSIETPATYTSSGKKTYSCADCGYSYEESVDPLKHAYSVSWSYDEAEHWHRCLDEGYEDLKSGAQPHSYVETVVDPTFETDGYTCYTCAECGYSYEGDYKSKLDHNYDSSWTYDEHSHWHACFDGGYSNLRSSEGEHDFAIEENPSTYELEGDRTYTCRICGYSYVTPIDKKTHTYSDVYSADETGHWHQCLDEGYQDYRYDYVAHDLVVDDVVEPTFESEGYTAFRCTVCGYSYHGDIREKISHGFIPTPYYDETHHWYQCYDPGYEDLKADYEEHTLQERTYAPTFESFGYVRHYCTGCDYYYDTDMVSPLQHNFSTEWTITDTHHYHACIDAGYEKSEVADWQEHQYSEWEVTIEPTATDDGLKARACAVCGHIEEEVIVNYNAQANEYLGFTLSSDGSYYRVTSLQKAFDTVFIPNEYNGLPVKSVRSLYPRHDTVRKIIISDNVETIEPYAFDNCIQLEEVVFGEGVKTIGEHAFAGCERLKELNFPDSLERIGYWCFDRCASLTSVTIPDSVTFIDYDAFKQCTGLLTVTLGANVTIDGSIFQGCTSLCEVFYKNPDFVLDQYIYQYYPLLAAPTGSEAGSFEIGEDCITYTLEGNKWYVGDLTGSESITIPDGTYGIKPGAFAQNKTIKTVTLNDGLQVIGNYSFWESAVETVNGIENVQKIGDNGFGQCSSFSLPEPLNIEIIGANAFYGCPNIKKLVLNSANSVGSYAFASTGIKELTVNNVVDADQFFGEKAFSSCPDLETVHWKADVDVDNPFLFEYTPNIKNMYFSTSVIPAYFCHDMKNLEHVEFLKDPILIGSGAFAGCEKLEGNLAISAATEVGGEAFKGTNYSSLFFDVGSATSYGFGCFPSSIGTISFGENVMRIPDYFASGGMPIEELIIPDTVKSIGQYAFYGCSLLEEIVIPDSVTEIGAYAFGYCANLKRLVIGRNVRSIGEHAFDNCPSLEIVYWNAEREGLNFDSISQLFYCCNSLKTVVFGEGVKRVPNYLMNEVGSLENVTFNEGLESIGKNAFAGTSIHNLAFPSTLESIETFAFYKCNDLSEIVIPDNVISLQGAFCSCENVKTVTIGKGLKEIHGDFSGCLSLETVYWNAINCENPDPISPFSYSPLTSVVFGEEVESVPAYLCNGVESVQTVRIPDSVKSIGDYAFSGVSPSYYFVEFGSGLETIGDHAFDFGGSTCVFLNHSSLEITATSLFGTYNGNLPAIQRNQGDEMGEVVIDGDYVYYIENGDIYLVRYHGSETNVVIPDKVTKVGNCAFYRNDYVETIEFNQNIVFVSEMAINKCPNLRTIYWNTNADDARRIISSSDGFGVVFGDVVTKIPERIFEYNFDLNSVVFSSNVAEIGNYAFRGCGKLTSVTLPSNLERIGAYAFYQSGIASISIPSSVTKIGDEAFQECQDLIVLYWNAENAVIDYSYRGWISRSLNDIYIGMEGNEINIPSSFYSSETKVTLYLGSNVKSIGDSAFNIVVDELIIEGNIERIGWSAFGSSSIGTLRWNANYQIVLDHAPFEFSTIGEVIFGEGVNSIPDNMFERTMIEEFIIPDQIKIIGENSFAYCPNLTSIVLGAGVLTICDGAFRSNPQLTTVIMNDNVARIGNSAFIEDSCLTEISLPSSLEEIGEWGFHLTPLQVIRFGDTMEEWSNIAIELSTFDHDVDIQVICSDGTLTIEALE